MYPTMRLGKMIVFGSKLVNTDSLWEVRITSGKNSYRILGFLHDNKLIILNHAFQKKTQKTPKQAIALAESRRKEYLNRGNNT